jgi:transposase-like protein
MQSALNAPHLRDEAAAFAYVEAALWPNGATCPHCGVVGEASRSTGKTTRMGLWNCRACRKPFTVRMGTVFESSHVPLHVWLQVIYLVCSSKKGISTRQIQRTIGGSMKTAWFLGHRIRLAMDEGALGPMGGQGGDVEADETYIGRDTNYSDASGKNKNAVLSLVDRQSGRLRSMVLANVTSNAVTAAVASNVALDTRLLTDSSNVYFRIGRELADHQAVNHKMKEYVRKADKTVHTNTVEGTFSIFKRGMRGIYQHCSAKHLPRYLAEFDFRYSNRIALGINDNERAFVALQGVAGKRLTYETVSQRKPGEDVRLVW